MSAINLILNILWLILGGGLMGLVWYLGGVLMAITIVGLPWARACFNIGRIILWPFGYEIRERSGEDVGTGPLGLIGNILWFIFAGVWLAIGHLVAAVGFFITIIGIPFALQHIKFVQISLFPIGKQVVAIDRD
ncbi:conserved domain protein [gamma proteobacterium HTCC5015]|nr:conserved domain protein [gamma proteobacterium HTCC5015]